MYEIYYRASPECAEWHNETTVSNKYYAIRRAKQLLENTDLQEWTVIEFDGFSYKTIWKGSKNEI